MDTDRAFFKLNSIFCFYVGLSFLTKAISSLSSQWNSGTTDGGLDQYVDLLLRHLASESFYFAVFAGYIPALMLVSMMIAFYVYLHQRSRWVALGAFLFGTMLSALWIFRRMFGTMMNAMAAQYIDTGTVGVRQDLFAQAKHLYYYDSIGRMLSGQTSLLAYALFGFLFLKGKGLEFFIGVLFLSSSVVLLIHQFTTPLSLVSEEVDSLILPALAFIFSGVLLWKYKTDAETWREAKLWVK